MLRDVEPDEVEQRERTQRMSGAEAHAGVHIGGVHAGLFQQPHRAEQVVELAVAHRLNVDAGCVAMLLLLAAVDEGLGALLFGIVPADIPAFRRAFDVPEHYDVVGCVAVGHPDPSTFAAAVAALAAFHDELWERTAIAPADTVLGGFSMGAVMSYALGLGPRRPLPAALLAFSGFIPTVEGWQPDLEHRRGLPVLIAHGRADPVIGVEFGRSARDALVARGLEVQYLESDVGHQIDGGALAAARALIAATVLSR